MFDSKLPEVGTTIFTVMSQLATKYGAINLSQGFPDFDADGQLTDLAFQSMKAGHNQYAPLAGILALREIIAEKTSILYGSYYNPDSEITITAGGTQAIFTAISAIIRPLDEVIIFEPAYDCYLPTVELYGGICVPIDLQAPDFAIDWNLVASKITSKTKLIILNNPNNPSTRCLSHTDMEQLAMLVEQYNLYLISDEVYEHITYDGTKHISVSENEILKKRAFIISSFGKTLHITGWKIGYCLAPEELMLEFRKVHQFLVFCVNAPMQYALAEYLKNLDTYMQLSAFYQQKRDYFVDGLRQTKFDFTLPQGTYFLIARYDRISDMDDGEFTKWLTTQHQVATIPLSAFYSSHPEKKWVRFCFAKKESTLDAALEKLIKI